MKRKGNYNVFYSGAIIVAKFLRRQSLKSSLGRRVDSNTPPKQKKIINSLAITLLSM